MDTWRYEVDADERDPLTAFRIPVTSSNPAFMYLISFDRMSEARPSDFEAIALMTYLRYKRDQHGIKVGEAMLRHPLDSTAGSNTVTFHKWDVNDWGYRKSTHVGDPLFYPGNPRDPKREGRFALLELLDVVETANGLIENEPWVSFKQHHVNVFNGS